MNESRDKFLTESFLGKCWHEPRKINDPFNEADMLGVDPYLCPKCRKRAQTIKEYVNPSYDDWPGFGILWQAAKKDEGWEEFISLGPDVHISATGKAMCPAIIPVHLIDPDTFATAWAKFLGWKEVE